MIEETEPLLEGYDDNQQAFDLVEIEEMSHDASTSSTKKKPGPYLGWLPRDPFTRVLLHLDTDSLLNMALVNSVHFRVVARTLPEYIRARVNRHLPQHLVTDPYTRRVLLSLCMDQDAVDALRVDLLAQREVNLDGYKSLYPARPSYTNRYRWVFRSTSTSRYDQNSVVDPFVQHIIDMAYHRKILLATMSQQGALSVLTQDQSQYVERFLSDLIVSDEPLLPSDGPLMARIAIALKQEDSVDHYNQLLGLLVDSMRHEDISARDYRFLANTLIFLFLQHVSRSRYDDQYRNNHLSVIERLNELLQHREPNDARLSDIVSSFQMHIVPLNRFYRVNNFGPLVSDEMLHESFLSLPQRKGGLFKHLMLSFHTTCMVGMPPLMVLFGIEFSKEIPSPWRYFFTVFYSIGCLLASLYWFLNWGDSVNKVTHYHTGLTFTDQMSRARNYVGKKAEELTRPKPLCERLQK